MERWSWGVEGGAEIKDRSKANGCMVTVIIRPAENHFVSYRAEGGKWFETGFQCSVSRPRQMCLDVFIYCMAGMCT